MRCFNCISSISVVIKRDCQPTVLMSHLGLQTLHDECFIYIPFLKPSEHIGEN